MATHTTQHSGQVGYGRSEQEQVDAVSTRSPAIAGSSTNTISIQRSLKMRYHNLIINATNPDFGLNYLVHETVRAEFVSPLLDRDFGPEYIAVPIGSTDPIPLREIIDMNFNCLITKAKSTGLSQSLYPFAFTQLAPSNSAPNQ